jgi:hypothetical protein
MTRRAFLGSLLILLAALRQLLAAQDARIKALEAELAGQKAR